MHDIIVVIFLFVSFCLFLQLALNISRKAEVPCEVEVEFNN